MDDKELAKLIATNVFKLRKLLGKEWDDFEKDADVRRTTISNWKSGTVPKIDHLYRICDAYDVSLDWLMGKSQCQRVASIPVTYGDWVNTLEEWLNTGIIKPFYIPELDNSYYDRLISKLEKLPNTWEVTTQALKKIYPTSVLGSEVDDSFYPKSDDPSETGELKVSDYSYFSFACEYNPYDIYNAEKDFNGTYPDIFQIKDTFLRCILAKLSYYKRPETAAEYKDLKAGILKDYGNEPVLQLDVYALFDTSHYKAIFGKYNGVAELDLKEIWNKLKELKKQNIDEINTKELEKQIEKMKKIEQALSSIQDEL